MGEENKKSNLRKTIEFTRDYWFLITLVISMLTAGFYFFFFDIHPLQKQYEKKIQAVHTGLHNNIGISLLRQGYFDKAKQEFSDALEYQPYDKDALNGKLLAELFLKLGSVDRNPAFAEKIKIEISKLDLTQKDELYLIRKKYFADLDLHNNKKKQAISQYDEILQKDSSYIDVLNTYAWLMYEEPVPEIDKMEMLFFQMLNADTTDYRACHGLGYTYYMKAIKEENDNDRDIYLHNAALITKKAYFLIFTRLHVLVDLGEVVRSNYPEYALQLHKQAEQFLDDPTIMELPENKPTLTARLLKSQGYVLILTNEQKKAWITYQLALDNLAMYRKYDDKSYLAKHKKLFKAAKKLDRSENIIAIYHDQKTILDILLPEQ